MGSMKDFESSSTLFGSNIPFIEELYEHYLADANSVSAEWRAYFDELRGNSADVAIRRSSHRSSSLRATASGGGDGRRGDYAQAGARPAPHQ